MLRVFIKSMTDCLPETGVEETDDSNENKELSVRTEVEALHEADLAVLNGVVFEVNTAGF